jgi:hypothetical protein
VSQDVTTAVRRRLLEEGQAALLERRAALATQSFGVRDSSRDDAFGVRDSSRDVGRMNPALQTSGQTSVRAAVAALPQQQTYHSARVTAVLRAALANQSRREAEEDPTAWLASLRNPSFTDPDAPATFNQKAGLLTQITLYPALALAILRHKLAGAGRLWHLLRALDGNGRGWLSHEEARAAFTQAGSPLRFCGPRQLRNLIGQGDGRFWDDDGERLWLRAPAKVAAGLGVARLDGRAVAAPLSAFTGGIAAVRAHLYASFHSGRDGAPVARRTIAAKSGVAPRTQRAYDRAAKVGRSANFARGPRLDTEAAEALAWRKGPACFTWMDAEGAQGTKGARYLAWQLPNSYDGPHAPLSRRAGKRIQRRLADLLTQGTAGNDQQADEAPRRAYFAGAKTAVAAHASNQSCQLSKKLATLSTLVYWPQSRNRVSRRNSVSKGQFWYVLW